jgi:hypothetical protein
VYPVVTNDTASEGSFSIEHVADPSALVLVWHRGLPSAVNDTQAPAIGDPVLVRVAAKRYSVPPPEREGGAAVNVVGICPTDRTASPELEPKMEVPE